MVKVNRRRKRQLLLMIWLVFGLLGTSLVHAGIQVQEAFGANVEVNWYGSIPSAFHEDELPIRSHLSVGATITPFALGFSESWEVSAGMSGFYTTRSMIYGTTIWRPFVAIGPSIDVTYHLDELFSFTGGLSIYLTMYTQTREFAPLWRLSASAGYDLLKNPNRNRLIVTIPVSVDLRTDYVSVTTGIGFKWRLDHKQEEVVR